MSLSAGTPDDPAMNYKTLEEADAVFDNTMDKRITSPTLEKLLSYDEVSDDQADEQTISTDAVPLVNM